MKNLFLVSFLMPFLRVSANCYYCGKLSCSDLHKLCTCDESCELLLEIACLFYFYSFFRCKLKWRKTTFEFWSIFFPGMEMLVVVESRIVNSSRLYLDLQFMEVFVRNKKKTLNFPLVFCFLLHDFICKFNIQICYVVHADEEVLHPFKSTWYRKFCFGF